MLDIKFIRNNPEIVRKTIQSKNINLDLDKLLALDARRRELIESSETLKAEQNRKSKGKQFNIEELKVLKDKIKIFEKDLDAVEKEYGELMLLIPNVPDSSVPEGKTDADNKEIRNWGRLPQFKFQPKNYVELMEGLDLVDSERGAKVSGFRGYFLKNEGVRLSFALWQFTLEHFVQKGFIPLISPAIARGLNFMGTGWLPQGKDEVYKVGDDEYLVGTAEVSVMGYHSGEILKEEELPKKYIAFSPCYRSEAGSYGKDTKGILRVHEFYKLEQVVLCRNDHEESVKWHEEITKNAEELVQALKLPYRVVINCAGDLGLGQVKKYDIETWLPSQKMYRETHSSSYFHDFQTRRLNIRYKDKAGEIHFAHSLNNTALATPRILANICENYQTKKGTVKIPKALRKYTGNLKEIKKLRN